MKTNSRSFGLALVLGAVVGLGAQTANAQPTLDQSVLTFKSVASLSATGHRPKWQFLPQSNDTYLERNKIERYHGMSSRPWSQIGNPRPSISDSENFYDVQPGISVVSLNF